MVAVSELLLSHNHSPGAGPMCTRSPLAALISGVLFVLIVVTLLSRGPPSRSSVSHDRRPYPTGTSETTSSGSTFLEDLAGVNWTLLAADDLVGRKQLLDAMIPWVRTEPAVAVNASCGPPELPEPTVEECVLAPGSKGVFAGKRTRPAKLASLIQLGFDVDTLEIHLNEGRGLVDRFFVIESTRAQRKGLRKPLIWQQIAEQERFAHFRSSVVNLVLDDAQSLPSPAADDRKADIWFLEAKQEKQRWLRFQAWNDVKNEFGDDDILIFGDADEIPCRRTLNLVKHCSLAADEQVDIGIVFAPSDVCRDTRHYVHFFPIFFAALRGAHRLAGGQGQGRLQLRSG